MMYNCRPSNSRPSNSLNLKHFTAQFDVSMCSGLQQPDSSLVKAIDDNTSTSYQVTITQVCVQLSQDRLLSTCSVEDTTVILLLVTLLSTCLLTVHLSTCLATWSVDVNSCQHKPVDDRSCLILIVWVTILLST